jgi:Tfp pilus assembly protein PilP
MFIRNKKPLAWLLSTTIALGVGVACGDDADEKQFKDFRDDQIRPGMPSIEARERLRKQRQKSGLIEKKEAVDDNKLDLPRLTEVSFIDGPKNRDPFMPFIEIFANPEEVLDKPQINVKLPDYDVAELKLIGIITNIGDPRAMVVAPDKTGYVLRRGDYVGRADIVRQGSEGETVQLNWRVARIHGAGKEEERGIYFVRDDPTTESVVDVTRFLPLHPHAN